MRDQFILIPLVISMGPGRAGGHGFLGWGWWLTVDFLIVLWLADLFIQVLGQLLVLSLLFCGLAR